jgi:hypothetical protein
MFEAMMTKVKQAARFVLDYITGADIIRRHAAEERAAAAAAALQAQKPRRASLPLRRRPAFDCLGPYPAAKNLVDILAKTNSRGLLRAVSREIHLFNFRLNNLGAIDDTVYRHTVELLRDEALVRVARKDWPATVKSHARSILLAEAEISRRISLMPMEECAVLDPASE